MRAGSTYQRIIVELGMAEHTNGLTYADSGVDIDAGIGWST